MKNFFVLLCLSLMIGFIACENQLDQFSAEETTVIDPPFATTDHPLVEAILNYPPFQAQIEAYVIAMRQNYQFNEHLDSVGWQQKIIAQEQYSQEWAIALEEFEKENIHAIVSDYQNNWKATEQRLQQKYPVLEMSFQLKDARRAVQSLESISHIKNNIHALNNIGLVEVSELLADAMEVYVDNNLFRQYIGSLTGK